MVSPDYGEFFGKSIKKNRAAEIIAEPGPAQYG